MIRARSPKWLLTALILLASSPALFAGQVTIDFEGFSDSTFITTQYSGLTVSNALVFTSGISLNELDFPPHSGVNVVIDSGPMSFVFSTPAVSFMGFFTYTVPVTVQGFDGSANLLDSVTSLFANNTATGGDPGSSPNELLQIASPTGFSSVTIAGDPGGFSFTLDDVTYTPLEGSSVPEPSTIGFAFTGLAALLFATKACRRR